MYSYYRSLLKENNKINSISKRLEINNNSDLDDLSKQLECVKRANLKLKETFKDIFNDEEKKENFEFSGLENDTQCELNRIKFSSSSEDEEKYNENSNVYMNSNKQIIREK